jgi:hypothetical protein
MEHLQVADGRDSLQIQRVALNILNKQSWTANMGGPPAWGLGKGLIAPHHKNNYVMKCHIGPWIW